MSVTDFWTPFELNSFLNALFIGLSIASIWLIAAVGLTIIYGTMGVINMAHGELIMLGAYTTYVLQTFFYIPFLLCLPLVFVIVSIFGLFIERTIIRRLYNRPLDTLLATWGLSLILIQGVRVIFGTAPKYVSIPGWLNFQVSLGFLHLPGFRLFIILATAALIFGTWYIAYRTTWGIRVRAVMADPDMASSFGIDSNRIYSITFAYGAGLAGVAGALFGGLKTLLPDMGSGYIVEAFLVVVVGGTQLLGSIFSSIILGELASIFSYFTNDTFARFVLFTLIVIFLRFRPQGLITEGMKRR
ncbi:MAG: urea ABC transporter permease subunit UrtB [Mesorhizobium sp. 61-13]|nr:urea ABC transporter permease subunit UrtB [Mesorhizobium sp.]OJU50488.1 MAG: urea ABC transporter permease subunit UrtB [Mesorhizobium sp. 61-13]